MKTKLIIAKANTAKAVMGSVASTATVSSMRNMNINSSYEHNITSGAGTSGANGWREVSKESYGSKNTTHYAI